jgi:hypothetical protein
VSYTTVSLDAQKGAQNLPSERTGIYNEPARAEEPEQPRQERQERDELLAL